MQNYEQNKLLNIHHAALSLDGNVCHGNTTPYSPPYLFSTENLVDTYHVISPANKDILTVAASGDHAFDAYLHGAHHVETFDFNLMQECVMHLKTDLIHYMTYNQFMNFFFGTLMQQKIKESYNIINKFIPHLSIESQGLIDGFYSSRNKLNFFHGQPFYNAPDYNYKSGKIAYIQSEQNFNTLKKRLPDRIDFTLADAPTTANTQKGNYDIIHLSNILSCTILASDDDERYEFIDFFDTTLRPLSNRLNIGGTLIANYIWGANFYNKLLYPYNQTFDLLLRNQRDLSANIKNLESVRDTFQYDSLLLIHKTR